LFMAAFRKWTS